jgi:hypothetical protein
LVPEGKWIAGGLLVLFIALLGRLLGGVYADPNRDCRYFDYAGVSGLAPTRQMIGFLPPLVVSIIALINAGYDFRAGPIRQSDSLNCSSSSGFCRE